MVRGFPVRPYPVGCHRFAWATRRDLAKCYRLVWTLIMSVAQDPLWHESIEGNQIVTDEVQWLLLVGRKYPWSAGRLLGGHGLSITGTARALPTTHLTACHSMTPLPPPTVVQQSVCLFRINHEWGCNHFSWPYSKCTLQFSSWNLPIVFSPLDLD